MADRSQDPLRHLQDPADVDSIESLDTARMTLRWALERLRALEKLNKEASGKADWELRMRLKAEDDFKQQWELEKGHVEAVEREREARLEAAFAAKLAEWERSYKEQAAALEEKSRAAVEKAKAEAEQQARRAREDYEAKLQNLERVEKDRLKELADKEREFDRYCSLQKANADLERRQIKADAQREAEERFKILQKLTEERLAATGGTWRRERDSLLKDLESWRSRAEEAMSRALELERTARNAETLARQAARIASDRDSEQQRASEGWERQRKALEQQLRQLHDALTQQEKKSADFERNRRILEEQARQASEMAADRQAEAGKLVGTWERQRATLEEQIKHWQERAAEAEKGAEVAREDGGRARREAERLEAEAKRRLAELEGSLAEREERIAAKEAELAKAVEAAVAEFNRKRAELERLKREALERVANRAAARGKGS